MNCFGKLDERSDNNLDSLETKNADKFEINQIVET